MGFLSNKTTPNTEKAQHRNVDTVIGTGAVFEGNLVTANSVCIEGTVKGHLQCEGRVILNKVGVLEADVVAEYISVNGTVLGNVKARKQLDVGENGVIQGDVEAASITIAKGGILKGSVTMSPDLAADTAPPAPKAGSSSDPRPAPTPSSGNGLARTGLAGAEDGKSSEPTVRQ